MGDRQDPRSRLCDCCARDKNAKSYSLAHYFFYDCLTIASRSAIQQNPLAIYKTAFVPNPFHLAVTPIANLKSFDAEYPKLPINNDLSCFYPVAAPVEPRIPIRKPFQIIIHQFSPDLFVRFSIAINTATITG
jgi:hypothetical protein